MTDKKFKGIIVPMVTPFTKNGEIDEKAVEIIVRNFINKNAAPFVLGTTGEGSSINFKQRKKMVNAAVKAADKKQFVYANISSNSFEESIEAAKQYFDLGIDAVAAHLPFYYLLSSDQMLKYYENLAEKINGPLILYNISVTTHMSIPLDVVEKLSHHQNIYGLKDSERDLNRLETAIKMFKDREDFSHLIGWGTQCFYGLSIGSDGLVPSTGNFVPGIYNEMYEAVLNNDYEKGKVLQSQTDELAKIYQQNKTLGKSLSALKVIMKELNFCEKYVLPPLTELSKNEEEEIIKNLNNTKEKFHLR